MSERCVCGQTEGHRATCICFLIVDAARHDMMEQARCDVAQFVESTLGFPLTPEQRAMMEGLVHDPLKAEPRRCQICGRAENNHNVRHQFQPWKQPRKPRFCVLCAAVPAANDIYCSKCAATRRDESGS